MRWVEIEEGRALEYVSGTRLVDNINGVDIRCSDHRLYDLLKYEDGRYYISEYSFADLEKAGRFAHMN